jgi:CRP/FNR family cyclic AMP-dependent transcriptional regulator
MDQIFRLFSECVLFRNLERREKEALFTRVRIRGFAAGETIFVIGSPGDSMMIVLRGTVQISVTSPKGQIKVTSPKGQPRVLGTLSPGEIFGEIAFLDGGARLADAIAITDCSLALPLSAAELRCRRRQVLPRDRPPWRVTTASASGHGTT